MNIARRAQCLAAVAIILAASSTSAAAQDAGSVVIDFERFELENGLTLIVHEDHAAPVVAVNVWYHVGSKNEEVGRTGLAHLFEHLMFSGSEHLNEDYFGVLDPLGATDLNGTTDKDRTNYFQTVPTSALDAVLWMESDRMGYLAGAIDQAKLDEQRGVVRNEILQEADQPYGSAIDVIFQSVFPDGHPYAWPIKGNPLDLDNASLEDAQDWIEKFYGAANAVLVVAGDVNSEDVRRKAAHYFGDVPAGRPIKRDESWIPSETGSRRVAMQDAVPQERLYKVWSVPGWGSPEAIGLDLVSDLIAGGPGTPLQSRLVREDRIATEVSAYIFELELGSLFVIEATAVPGVLLADLETAIDEELARFGLVGPSSKALDGAKTNFRAEFIRGMERVGGFGGKSDILAEGEVYAGRPDFYRERLRRVADATPVELQSLAAAWLGESDLVLEVSPTVVATSSASDVDRTRLPDVGEAPAAVFPTLERARLTNGLDVIVAHRDAAPLVDFRVIVNAGYSADALALPGTAAMAMSMLESGTKRRTGVDIADEIQALGATYRAGSNMDISVATLSALKENLRGSLDLFADVVLYPTFPDEDFELRQTEQLATVQQEKSDPVALAMRLLPKLLYGDTHPYGSSLTGSGTEPGLRAMTRETLAGFHATWFRPGNATLIVVGATTLEEILPDLERSFGSWAAEATPTRSMAEVTGPESSAFYLVDRPGAEQSTILVGQLAPPKSNPNELALSVANAVLGGDFGSRINMNLREDKQWTYGAQSLFFDQVTSRPFVVFAPVQTDRTADAVREIATEISAIGADRPITEGELLTAVRARVLAMPGQWQTNADLMNGLTEMVEYGTSPEDVATLADRLRSLDAAGVSEVAGSTFRTDRMVWIVIGDRAVIEAELGALALGPIFEMDADGAILSRVAEGNPPTPR